MFKFFASLAPARAPADRLSVAIRGGRYREALEIADGLVADAGDDPERLRFALNKRGVILVRLGDADGARAAFLNVLELHVRDAPALTNLGNLELEAQRYELAIEHYDAAIDADRDYPNAYYNKSIALKALGRIAESVRARRLASRLEVRLRQKQRKLL